MLREKSFTAITPFEYKNKNMCREVQRDPYANLLTNWE